MPAVPPVNGRKVQVMTLVFVFTPDHAQVLLGYKKRGLGQGLWNGFGGKVNGDETVIEAAVRELEEESGLRSHQLTSAGLLYFTFEGEQKLSHSIFEVHVFTTSQTEGDMGETEEMRPQWFDVDSIPYSNMWPDDPVWLPLLLKGQRFQAYFSFQGQQSILQQEVDELAQGEHFHVLSTE